MDFSQDSPPKYKDAWKKLCFHNVNNRTNNSHSLCVGKSQKKYKPTINNSFNIRRSFIFNNSNKKVSPKKSQADRQMNRKNQSLLIGFKELQIDSSFKVNFRSKQRGPKTILKPSSFLKREIGSHQNSFLLNLSESKLNISVIKNKTAEQLSEVKKQLIQSQREIKSLKKFIHSQLTQFHNLYNRSVLAIQNKYQDRINELIDMIEKIKPGSTFTIPQDQSEIPQKSQYTYDSGDYQIENQLKNYLYPLKVKRLASNNDNQRQFRFNSNRNSVTFEFQKVKQQKLAAFKNIKQNQKTSNNSFDKMFEVINCLKKDLDDTLCIKQIKRSPMTQLLQNFDNLKEVQKSSLMPGERKKINNQNIFDDLIYKKSLRG